MGVLKATRFWRALGKSLNTGVGAAIAGQAGQVVNRMAALGAPSLDGDVPWAPLEKPLQDCRVALVSTAGFHLAADAPFDVDADAGDPSFRAIPNDAERGAIRIAHTHYTHRFVDQDLNVLLPIDRLAELAGTGAFTFAPRSFSFGFCGTLTAALISEPDGTAHHLAAELDNDQVDLAIFIPA